MKVVLFCGGLGTRLREHSETIPKSLVPVGVRPLLWHLMKYYAHFGHKDFILCLGYKGDLIKEFFLRFNPYLSCDFVMSKEGARAEPSQSDVPDWRITFVDTGLHTNIGQRLKAVEPYLREEEMFFANYSDGLSDLPLNEYLEVFKGWDATASFVAVRPSQSFHDVAIAADGRVTKIEAIQNSHVLINGGYMILRREIFDHIGAGEELVEQPFRRLIERGKLFAYRYHGFWAAMDTFKDKINLDRMDGRGERPWEVWQPWQRAQRECLASTSART